MKVVHKECMQEQKILNSFIEWRIIVKKMEGNLSLEEEQAFSAWFEADVSHQKYYEKVCSAWDMELSLALPDVEEMILIFDKTTKVSDEIQGVSRKNTVKKIHKKYQELGNHGHVIYSSLLVAAAIACIVVMSIVFVEKLKEPMEPKLVVQAVVESETLPEFIDREQARLILSDGSQILLDTLTDGKYRFEREVYLQKKGNVLTYSCGAKEKSIRKNTIFVPRGQRYDLRLSDGSKVCVNAETILKFPIDFAVKKRQLHLDGEAFFDVISSELPFMVKTDKAEVKVYGTTFNVCAYSLENVFTTSLVSGSVGITRHEKECKLKAGQEAVIDQTSEFILIQNSNTYASCSWLSETLIFENERLETIANKISRMYDVSIEFSDPSLKNLHFTGDFDKSRGLHTFFEILESITHVNIKSNKNKILIDNK